MYDVEIPFVRSANNYDMDAVSLETGLHCHDPSLAQQSAKEECDINHILSKYALGVDPVYNGATPQYGDFTIAPESYHDAFNTVASAQEAFHSLPARVRARFDNSPLKVLEFVSDNNNYEEAVSLGLIERRPSGAGDLSIGPAKRPQEAGKDGPVGKSTSEGESRPKAPPSPIKGYRLIADTDDL